MLEKIVKKIEYSLIILPIITNKIKIIDHKVQLLIYYTDFIKFFLFQINKFFPCFQVDTSSIQMNDAFVEFCRKRNRLEFGILN